MAYPQETFSQTQLTESSLLQRRRDVLSSNTLLYQLDVLKKTGRYDAFKLQWHPSYTDTPMVWPIPNHLFWDSDIAKWIEGACYLLRDQSNPKVEHAIHELVGMIASAQQADGYLNIHYTVVEPGKRFTNLRDFHELYNAGHLIEAALAHHDHFKTTALLDPILKYVDLLAATFGPGADQIHGYPGHPEIELALLRLYHRTQNPSHLALASYFINERGNPTGSDGKLFFDHEAERRGDNPHLRPQYWPSMKFLYYYQADKPIVEQDNVEGHSVRCMYLLTGAADLARLNATAPAAPNGNGVHHHRENGLQNGNSKPRPARTLEEAVRHLWTIMLSTKTYLTGGIGSVYQYEGFGLPYSLPQSTAEGGCYAETCASIALVMFGERLLSLAPAAPDRSIADVMELAIYNAILTSMSHDGKKFTYVNQLASSDGTVSQREEWFTCSCCPPNVLRFLGSIGGYLWNRTETDGRVAVNVHFYVPAVLKFTTEHGEDVEIEQAGGYPWDGAISFTVRSGATTPLTLRLRIPAWAEGGDAGWSLSPALPHAPQVTNGYLVLPEEYVRENPSFTMTLPLQPRLVTPHPYTNQDTLAVMRGPIVYCVEDVDNDWVDDHFMSTLLSPHPTITETLTTDATTSDTYVGLTARKSAATLDVSALRAWPGLSNTALEAAHKNATVIDELHFVPYYFRSNRGGRGHMRVGLRKWLK